ncbi:ribonuclease III domain-containing protein [Amylocarpus encephaloides]|uniref:Ribonuclease III domain-containing protein n=1 Tax=Amylocarpus encephaloides TaxID=45428 RepID=A0A9P7YH83_9HELO|nr:ribonuclease III domain-containing protein [Amylocarpus encephaloides]
MEGIQTKKRSRFLAEPGTEIQEPKRRRQNNDGEEQRNVNEEQNPAQNSPALTAITKLLQALDEAIKASEASNETPFIDDESLKQCVDLQASLQRSRPENQPETRMPSSNRKHMAAQCIPKAFITPWVASEIPRSLPPLPAILDKTIEKAAFTHKAMDPLLNYEQLEWIGDSYLEHTATLLISQTFFTLQPGRSAQYREQLVKNSNLEKYCVWYGLEKRLPPDLDTKLDMKRDTWVKTKADLFEAYVAAVVLSDPQNGLARVTKWLKDLLGMTLRDQIAKAENDTTPKVDWLWKPVGNSEANLPPPLPAHPKDELQVLLGGKGVRLYYQDIGPPGKDRFHSMPTYTVGVFLTGWGEKDRKLGQGTGRSKKDAGAAAAEMALKSKKMMAPYIAKKHMYDHQRGLERQALEEAQALEKL